MQDTLEVREAFEQISSPSLLTPYGSATKKDMLTDPSDLDSNKYHTTRSQPSHIIGAPWGDNLVYISHAKMVSRTHSTEGKEENKGSKGLSNMTGYFRNKNRLDTTGLQISSNRRGRAGKC